MDIGQMFDEAINHWRDNNGIGTALIPAPLNDKYMLLEVLQRICYNKSDTHCVIIVENFNIRNDIIEFLTHQENEEENNNEFDKLIKDGTIKIFTINYISNNKPFNYPLLCIVYRPESIVASVYDYLINCKFKLVILNKLLTNSEDMITLYRIVPLLKDFKQNEINQIRLSTPVEERQISITIPIDSEDYKLLRNYNDYITTSINIFGSFNILNKAIYGDKTLNISANQLCYNIAEENGWNEHLDMTIGFNIEIDKLYNPVSLKERASQTYEVIRERTKLLASNNSKLEVILDIVNNNQGKKILIINKFAEFASKVTDYINNMSEENICGNYHDKVDNIPAIDINGNPLYYKSGSKKGERKVMGAKAQKTLNVKLFNLDKIRILSTNNAVDKNLAIDVDIIIITSPLCEDINSYMYRLDKINFRNSKVELYSLYIKDSIEQKSLDIKSFAINHIVKNDNNNELLDDFVVVD